MRSILLSSIFYIFYLCPAMAQAPSIQWQKCFGGTESDQAATILQTNDGGYIVVNTTLSDNGNVSGNHGGSDIWVLKLKSAGELEWQKCIGGSQAEVAHDILQTSDGGYLIAGSTQSNEGDVSGNHGASDAWIVKLNTAGIIEWQKTFGGTDDDNALAIRQTSDGGFIMIGDTRSNDGDVSGNHGGADVWLVKLASTGNLQWQKCLGGTEDDFGTAVLQSEDDGFILSGNVLSNDNDVSGNHGNSDIWVVKLNKAGVLEWQKCLGGKAADNAGSICKSEDGGYILAGSTKSANGDVSNNHGASDGWIVKLNKTGVIQWQQCFGGSVNDVFHSITPAMDGGYIVAGFTFSKDGDVKGNHGNNDIWLIKINENGQLQWQQCLGGSGNDYNNPGTVQPTSDGGYVMAGYVFSNDGDVSGNHGNYDSWVVKFTGNTLPVTLMNFSAQQTGPSVLCKWETAQESNSSHFEIQRSIDGQNFEKVGRVDAAGFSNNKRSYNFIDENVHKLGVIVLYYRLKQVDLNGKTSLGHMVTVKLNNSSSERLQILGNPAKDILNVQINGKNSEETAVLQIVDSSGKILSEKKISFSNYFATGLEIKNLNRGLYFLILQTQEGREAKRFIKQ